MTIDGMMGPKTEFALRMFGKTQEEIKALLYAAEQANIELKIQLGGLLDEVVKLNGIIEEFGRVMQANQHIDEVWVGIDNLPNYEVSNYGRVVNINTGRDLNPYPDKRTGLLRVALYHKGVRSDVLVHRLVAAAFFLNYAPNIEVKHRNGNKEDNTVYNLTLAGVWRKTEDPEEL